MATSKTLKPTNVTISIPAFTDQPDQRVISNCIDEEADAINALNTKVQARNATGIVTCASLKIVDTDFTLNKAFTNNPQSYVCTLAGSTTLYPICIRSWTDSTHCNARIFNVGEGPATNVSHTFRILGFAGTVNDE